MIVFLNFAPIEFMGGAEKWMYDTAKKVGVREKTHLVSVDPSISNVYGKLILKREFEKRTSINHPYSKINLRSFIPFTSEWNNISKVFKSARIIYAKYEIQEIAIIVYFSGFSSLQKTVAGLHSPLIYSFPLSFVERVHNLLYSSPLSGFLLKRVKKVHVLNNRDEEYIKKRFLINNVEQIPNSVVNPKDNKFLKARSDRLKALFVGELSERKGVDILLGTARMLTPNITLTIVGDGPMKKEAQRVAKKNKNVVYKGYISDENVLARIYREHDVLILPSRAESMPLSILEAVSNGLQVVDSKEASVGLDEKIEHSIKSNKSYPYLRLLYDLSKEKEEGKFDKKKVAEYFKKTMSKQKIDREILTRLFN